MSSSRSGRGLFRLFIGAALVRAVWDAWWKWALPRKRPNTVSHVNVVMKDLWGGIIEEQLIQTRVLFGRYMYGDPARMTIQDSVNEALEDIVPGKHLYYQLRIFWHRFHPVIMTAQKRDELGWED